MKILNLSIKQARRMMNNSGTAESTLVCCEPTKDDKNSRKSGTTTAVPAVPGALCLLKND